MESEAAALTGKINKKARTEKLKQILAIEKSPEYIDACLVVSGQPSKFGNFKPQVDVEAPHVKAAIDFKAEADARKAAIEAEAAELTGKINKNARTEKLKQSQEIIKSPKYSDACRVIMGQLSEFGHFAEVP